jgi:hypothetical protein
VSDICSPVGTKVYWSQRRALIAVLFIVSAGIAAFSWSAVKEETQKCSDVLWRFVMYKLGPETYAKKCGCPNNLDFRFSCNSQYLHL